MSLSLVTFSIFTLVHNSIIIKDLIKFLLNFSCVFHYFIYNYYCKKTRGEINSNAIDNEYESYGFHKIKSRSLQEIDIVPRNS